MPGPVAIIDFEEELRRARENGKLEMISLVRNRHERLSEMAGTFQTKCSTGECTCQDTLFTLRLRLGSK